MKPIMLIKSDLSTSAGAGPGPVPTKCGNCGVEERRLLHHVRHRGIFRRLCTTCVLRLHPQSFCPTCFAVYHPPPPPSAPNDAITCFKCYSTSHARCVGPNFPNPYICPNCVNPNFPIFTPKKAKDLGFESSEAGNGDNGEFRVIDKKAAKILLAAARIAAVSMSKAAVAARVEAERRAKEAAITRKRAREALEHVSYLVANEKLKKKEAVPTVTVANEVSRVAGRGGGGVIVANASGNNSKSSVGSANIRVGMVMERINGSNVGNMERINGSNGVVAALNAAELREGEKRGELMVDNVKSGDSAIDVVAMDVEEDVRLEMNNDGRAVVERSGKVDYREKNHGGGGKNVSNGDAVVLPAEDQVQPMERNQSPQENGHESGH